jgi:hypothetical protein
MTTSPPHPMTCAPMTTPVSPGRSTNATPRPSSGYAPSWLNSSRRAGKRRQRRQYSGPRIVANLQRAGIAHADKVRLVLSDEQYNDVTTRRADGESWAGLARAYGMTQTTLMAAYARQTAAKRQDGQQCR